MPMRKVPLPSAVMTRGILRINLTVCREVAQIFTNILENQKIQLSLQSPFRRVAVLSKKMQKICARREQRIYSMPSRCQIQRMIFPRSNYAEIAQLVEHNLAKVGVASSSLVFRSIKRLPSGSLFFVWMYGLPDSDSRPLPEGAVGGAD